MSTFILIHDAWQSAWCWRRVAPLLTLAGHTVLAPDLPSHGDDLTPLACVTLEAYVRYITDLIDTRPAEEQIILVGHGFAGMVISQVAEQRPGHVRCLVYLSALLPASGETALQLTERTPHPLFAGCVAVHDLCVEFLPDQTGVFLFQDCELQEREEATAHVTAQPLSPLVTPVHLGERFASVPRIYLTCRYDLFIPPEFQRLMYTAMPCEHVLWLMTGHSPMLSAPDRLTARLLGIARLLKERN